jgi:uncharacterized membrane protein YGL010W
MIFVASVGLLSPFVLWAGPEFPAGIIEFARLDGGTLALLLSWIWYFRLDYKLALPFALFSMGLYVLGRTIPVPYLWALFVSGWIIQFVGHGVYEKKSPAFFKNVEHLLIGPLWVFAKLIRYRAE